MTIMALTAYIPHEVLLHTMLKSGSIEAPDLARLSGVCRDWNALLQAFGKQRVVDAYIDQRVPAALQAVIDLFCPQGTTLSALLREPSYVQILPFVHAVYGLSTKERKNWKQSVLGSMPEGSLNVSAAVRTFRIMNILFNYVQACLPHTLWNHEPMLYYGIVIMTFVHQFLVKARQDECLTQSQSFQNLCSVLMDKAKRFGLEAERYTTMKTTYVLADQMIALCSIIVDVCNTLPRIP